MITVINFLIKHTWIRFIIAGGTSAFVNLTLLFVLHNSFGIYYLLSSTLAFIGAFGVSFTLHKYWTFKSHTEDTNKQVILYLGTSLFGLILNIVLMYVFVDIFGVGVMLSQLFVGAIVAFSSFFISRTYVFRPELSMSK